jgi:hypothetical protein
MFFISCNSSKVVEKTIYYVPEVDFPEVPKLGDCEILKDGRVATDEGFFRKFLAFKTLYSDALLKYEDKKKLYEKEE